MAFKVIFGKKFEAKKKAHWNDGKKLADIAEISNWRRKIIYNVIIAFKANIKMS